MDNDMMSFMIDLMHKVNYFHESKFLLTFFGKNFTLQFISSSIFKA